MTIEKPNIMMEGSPKVRTVHSAFIADEIEREIVAQHWPAGAKLDEVALAKRFGVSRTPVREALQVVVSRSLAERMPYKGVIVADITRERIDQMFESMGEIEALCGRFAADRMTMEERSALEMLHTRMNAMALQGDFKSYEEANTVFHSSIYRGTQNQDLIEIAEAMRVKLSPFRSSQLKAVSRVARSNEEHGAIVSAILDRNGKEAERALRRHLISAAQAVLSARR